MNREALLNQLIVDESLELKPYEDSVGCLTIGIGRNLTDRGISREEALGLCRNDIASVESDLDARLSWWRSLSEERQQVLANMCFNLGIGRLLGFKNTLAYVKAGNYEAAARGMLNSKWARQVGARATRLAARMRQG